MGSIKLLKLLKQPKPKTNLSLNTIIFIRSFEINLTGISWLYWDWINHEDLIPTLSSKLITRNLPAANLRSRKRQPALTVTAPRYACTVNSKNSSTDIANCQRKFVFECRSANPAADCTHSASGQCKHERPSANTGGRSRHVPSECLRNY